MEHLFGGIIRDRALRQKSHLAMTIEEGLS